MSEWERLSRLHGYQNLGPAPVDVAIFGIAVRVGRWSGLCEHLASTNDCSFKIFFCGPIRPSHPLPESLVYIHSEMKPAACAEIARRLALDEGAAYIMDMPDDFVTDHHLLDRLISELNAVEGEAVVAPGFRPRLKAGIINASSRPDGVGRACEGVNLALMKHSTALKMGGVDRRFEGSYYPHDQLMRLEALGDITFKVCRDITVAEDESTSVDQGHPRGRRLSKRFCSGDGEIYIDLWHHDGTGSRRRPGGRSRFPVFEDPPRRKTDVQLYDEASLTYTVHTAGDG